MKKEFIVLNEERNVTLTAYIQPVGGEYRNIVKRPGMIVIPGGGYKFCSDREADPVALQYARAGYQVFVLRYSVRQDSVWPNPLLDYDQAMELIRNRADEWNIYEDKIGVIGFSAGGHLAASAATLSKNRPNAAILGYAVTRGETVHELEKTAPDTVSAVDKNTCPCFVFTSRTDTVVSVKNSIEFINALADNDISFESHIYSYGPHGFSTCESSVTEPGIKISNRAPSWVNDSIEWLKEVFGDFDQGEMTEPKYKSKINDNSEEFLSIDCTISHLMSNEKTREIAVPLIKKMMQALNLPDMNDQEDINEDSLGGSIAKRMTLRDILEFTGATKELYEEINSNLNRIPNK